MDGKHREATEKSELSGIMDSSTKAHWVHEHTYFHMYMHTYSALLQTIKRPWWVIQTQKLSHCQAVKENMMQQ